MLVVIYLEHYLKISGYSDKDIVELMPHLFASLTTVMFASNNVLGADN